MPSESVEFLTWKVDELRAALSRSGQMRPGVLVERYRSCGKPTCHCAKKGSRGHGPCWSLTRVVDGKTVTKVIPSGSLDETRAQLETYKRFKATVREFVDVNVRLCDARLEQRRAASKEAAKKGGSK